MSSSSCARSGNSPCLGTSASSSTATADTGVLWASPILGRSTGWARRAAPSKRNDQLLQSLPIGVIVFPGSGITDNLADKAKIMGIPVWRFEGGA